MLLAPAFLFGLLAIAVPLWLHRVAQANPTRHPFASLMFLEASETQRAAQRTLRYWSLLALRVLLLIALALAFAGPLLKQKAVPNAGADASLHAIVIDTSLSMQYAQRWRRALQTAESILGELRGADRVMLVAAGGRRIEVVRGPTAADDAGTLRAALHELKPGIERLDYGLVMSTAQSWLGSPRPPVILHWISDLQRSAAPMRFADLQLPPQTQLVVHDVADPAAENFFIQSAALTTLDTRAIEVSIRGTAATAQHREVVLTIDGKEHARRGVDIPGTVSSISLPPGEGGSHPSATLAPAVSAGETGSTAAPTTSAALKVVFPDLELTPGVHRIELALVPQDALPQDDRHYAVLEQADPKVLLITRDPDADEAAYFAAATESVVAPKLTVEQRTADAITSDALSGYSLLVVPDLTVLADAQAQRIKEYVGTGGSVLATLGPGDAELATPLLERWRIGEPRRRAAGIAEIATAHPVLRDAGGWHGVRFFRQRPVRIASDDRVLIAHEDATPLLVERTVGAGRMLVLTAPVAREWNDLAVHPLFVRFIAEAARYLIRGAAAATSSTAGATVTTGLTAAGGGQIFDPRGARVFGLAQRAMDRFVPDQLGFYEVRGQGGPRWVAVNVDGRESDLTPLPAAFVQRWQAMQVRPAATTATALSPAATSQSIGPLLVWVAAALLLLELLLANRYLAVRREMPNERM